MTRTGTPPPREFFSVTVTRAQAAALAAWGEQHGEPTLSGAARAAIAQIVPDWPDDFASQRGGPRIHPLGVDQRVETASGPGTIRQRLRGWKYSVALDSGETIIVPHKLLQSP